MRGAWLKNKSPERSPELLLVTVRGGERGPAPGCNMAGILGWGIAMGAAYGGQYPEGPGPSGTMAGL